MYYGQISVDEYQKFKIRQDFELRDFEELSLFLIDLENDDIDYYRIKDNRFSIKFWGKKKPIFFNYNPTQEFWIPTYDVGSHMDDINRLLADIMNEAENRNRQNDTRIMALPFPYTQQIGTQTTSTTTTQLITTSTTTTTTTNRKEKKEKYFNPIHIQIDICKIPDEYFLVNIQENRTYPYPLNIAYFKIDQIDGLIEFIKFVFDTVEIADVRKKNDIDEMLDSIINL